MSGLIVPAFIYDPGSGNVTFVPTYPNVNKLPQGSLNAIRHDSITSSGVKQSVIERIETLNTFEFANVPQSDLAGWYAFLGFALGGGFFTWYADSTNLVNGTRYTLEDTGFTPKRSAYQNYGFTFNVRQVVPQFVNSASHAEIVGAGTTAVVTLNGVKKGNLIIVAFGSDNDSVVLNAGLGITDSAGNVYTALPTVNANGGGALWVAAFSTIATTSGNIIITAAGAASTNRRLIHATQFKGAKLDGFSKLEEGGGSALGSPRSCSLLPGQPSDLILAVCMVTGFLGSQINIQAGDGWLEISKVLSNDTTAMSAGYVRASALGAKNITFTYDFASIAIGMFGISF